MTKKPKRIYLTSLQQPDLLGNIAHLPFDPLKNKEVEKLRSYTKIEKIFSKHETDFVQALKIAKFTSEAWGHDGFNSNPKKQDALTILKLADKGASFACVQFASVFVQLCQSVGIPARVLNVRTKHPDLGSSGHGHVTAEYFDNQLCKWVWIDPQIHAYALNRNTPLSYNELAELIVTGKNPTIKFTERTLTYIKNNKAHLKLLKNFVRRYIWSTRIGGLKSFYSKQSHLKNIGCKRNGVQPAITFQGFADKSPTYFQREIFDAPLNACHIQFETKAPRKLVNWKDLQDYKDRAYLNFAKPEVTMILKNSMPWFESYIVIINGNKKILKTYEITIKLRDGLNTIQVQAMNGYKRCGPMTTAEIRYDNRYKNVKSYW
ncbi:transglutaminase-like domain-containing protein [Bdellovibrio sp. BCCA]|uniref:transglutaminase-like domain-containing protein n=1 Tax=Bdellovibrio sp. BCCA TaxID=3136281 RepID=UPI0030F32E6A